MLSSAAVIKDIRLAFRNLSRSRGFAVVAVTTLAIGIGGSIAMFSALRALVVQPFALPEADRIVQVWSGGDWPLSTLDFVDLREKSVSFESFGAYSPETANVGEDNPKAVVGVNCTAGVLKAFGMRPLMGRWLEETDEVDGAAPVAVISHGLWQELFGGDPDLVGSLVRINGGNFTVVGIMPSDFEFTGPWILTDSLDLWQPLKFDLAEAKRDDHWLNGVARLNKDVTVGQADAEIKAIGIQLSEQHPDSNTNKKFLVRSLYFEVTRDVGSRVWLLFAAVLLVLLIACANVANMLLARNAGRQSEFGVRVALGATRRHLVGLSLVESGVLAVFGSAAGLAVALAGIRSLQIIVPASEARKTAIAIDGPVLVFALGVMAVATLLVGLPPALAAARTSVEGVIRGGGRGTVGSRARHNLLRGLIIGQVALAFIMANGAVLFSASYLQILEENENLSSEYVLTAQINLYGERYDEDEDRVRFWEQLIERLEPLPGVSAVGITSKLPLEGGSNTNGLVNDEVYDPAQQRLLIERSSITPGFFEAMGLRLIKGRNLLPEDAEGEIRGVVVNQTMVEKAWPDKEPLGELIRGNSPDKPWFVYRVVGVVEDARQWGPTEETRPEMYTLPKGHWGQQVNVIIRSQQPAGFLAPLLRREVGALDGELAVDRVRTYDQVVADGTQSQRTVAGLVNFFMLLALGLVAVGLYGTLSHHVLQRTREIGVRMAVGAVKRDILKLVFVQGSRWVLAGVAIGLIGTLALSSVMQALVYGMDQIEVTPMVLAAAAVSVAAIFACWLPALRAARMDPVVALRAD